MSTTTDARGFVTGFGHMLDLKLEECVGRDEPEGTVNITMVMSRTFAEMLRDAVGELTANGSLDETETEAEPICGSCQPSD